jgi:alpha-L-arabinofuranosidase
MVDEHYYEKTNWFWDNLDFYDKYDRSNSAVYLGEYAAHENDRRSTLRSALAEAAYMTSLERNGDLVRLVSYAPLLAKRGYTQWTPDLIYFDNTTTCLSINYYVQQLFSTNGGDTYLPTTVVSDEHAASFAASCVKDTNSDDLILKLVSRADIAMLARLDLRAASHIESTATCTVICGDPLAENAFAVPPSVLPATSRIETGQQFTYLVPPYSLSIIRIKTRNAQ